MRRAWRVADIRAAEEAFMATVGEGTLMQRAATALARRCASLLADRTGGVYGRRVLLLVGAGNNGGDALFGGAALARRGALVMALPLDSQRIHREGLAALRSAGGLVVAAVPSTVDLLVDGILGIGGRGGLRESAAGVVAAATDVRGTDGEHPTRVAVDLPSGIDADTGAVAGPAFRADVTVTFGALKPGLLVGAGAVHSGLVELADIGLQPWLRGDPAVEVPETTDVSQWWPRPDPRDDKYRRGVVGLATGSARYPGAAVLSVAGALAGPVGMVRYAGAAADAVRLHHPPVVPSSRVAEAGRVQAWVCGSGLGTDEWAAGELRAVLGSHVPACLDADALTLLVDGKMAGRLRRRDAPTAVTPHDREFARLFGAEPGPDRVGSAQQLASWMNAVVLLKGDRTIVATPDGRAYVNPSGTPALATAGTGDVLAGLLGSLLAAGLLAEQAAVAAAYVHGLAGRHAAESGPVTAVQVAESLRAVLAGIGLGTVS
jgi:hydroxyethylthiazole kinase-like uncharacterized protein yjeF